MIVATKLSMRYGAKILFKNVDVQFNKGHHYGLIGANGSGKSTFLKILAGELSPESGEVAFATGTTIGTLKQDHFLYENMAICDVVLQGRQKLWQALQEKEELLKHHPFTEIECEKLTVLEKIIEEQSGYSAEADASKLLEGLGIRTLDHKRPLSILSGGYKLRVLLAQLLFAKPAVLMLDEPTNHLDLFSIRWLEGYLKTFEGTLLVISHDRDFLNAISDSIVDFDYATIKIYKGNYHHFLELKQFERDAKEATFAKQEKKSKDLQQFIDRFGAKATKAKQAQSRARMVEKIQAEMNSIDFTPSSRITPKITFEPLRASGVNVLKVASLAKAYAAKKVLQNLSFEIERGEKLAILGPNGIGKSTLLEILAQQILADEGKFEWGFAVRVGYFPQDYRRELNQKLNLLEWLNQFDPDLPQEKVREMLARVLFSGDVVNQSIQTLSGGESARLILAKLMLQKPNVILLDEPTNHLDMEAIDTLVEALNLFEGTVILVSHNRYFVSHIATRILEIDFEKVSDYRCSFEQYLLKQDQDYLSAQTLSQRHLQGKKEEQKEKAQLVSYEEQKKIKSLKAQAQKQVKQAEEECHRLELKINEHDLKISAEDFYQEKPASEQQKVFMEKEQVEKRLEKAMKMWEGSMTNLQEIEKNS